MDGFSTILMIVAMFGFVYFTMIRPQNKDRANHDTLLANLKRGDAVVLTSGIYGTIDAVETDSFIVEIAKGTKIKVLKTSISLATIKLNQQEAGGKVPQNTAATSK